MITYSQNDEGKYVDDLGNPIPEDYIPEGWVQCQDCHGWHPNDGKLRLLHQVLRGSDPKCYCIICENRLDWFAQRLHEVMMQCRLGETTIYLDGQWYRYYYLNKKEFQFYMAGNTPTNYGIPE